MASQAEHAASERRLNDLLACVQLARGFGLITVGQYSDAYDALRRLFDPAFDLAERYHGGPRGRSTARHRRTGRGDGGNPSATLARHLSYARAVLADDDHAEEEFTKALRAPAILSVG